MSHHKPVLFRVFNLINTQALQVFYFDWQDILLSIENEEGSFNKLQISLMLFPLIPFLALPLHPGRYVGVAGETVVLHLPNVRVKTLKVDGKDLLVVPYNHPKLLLIHFLLVLVQFQLFENVGCIFFHQKSYVCRQLQIFLTVVGRQRQHAPCLLCLTFQYLQFLTLPALLQRFPVVHALLHFFCHDRIVQLLLNFDELGAARVVLRGFAGNFILFEIFFNFLDHILILKFLFGSEVVAELVGIYAI